GDVEHIGGHGLVLHRNVLGRDDSLIRTGPAIHRRAAIVCAETDNGGDEMIYVSMTGFRPRGALQLPRFWWRTVRSLAQARRAPGNLLTAAR
ncbi:hypothetical protein, partial [Aeromonas veronii]